jgi:hypothetical protein
MAKRPSFNSAQDVADHYGISAKKVRALHRKAVRASGGTIGKDTPGRGKRYAKDTFAQMAENVEAALSTASEADASE